MKKLSVFLAGLLLAGITLVQAQTVRITGTVTSSEDGMPMPGVSVVVKGTTIGATTDVDGKYDLAVPANAQTLTFSFVGYETQDIAVAGRSVIDVVMKPESKQIEEVVVTGYTTRTKNSLTGSTVQVKSEALKDIPVISVDQSLQGKVAGMTISASSGTPGSIQDIRIRGAGSLSASNEPLVVIDGVPVINGDLSGAGSYMSTLSALSAINNNDIESISVLKDASATSAYGARGSNGVIVITTKKGKVGKTQFSATAFYGFQNKAVEGRKVLTGSQREELFLEALYNTYGTVYGFTEDQAYNWALSLPTSSTPYVRAQLLKAWIDAGRPVNDWDDAMRNKNAPMQNIQISATGGDNSSSFYASLGYNKTESITVGADFKRVSGVLNYSKKLTEKIKLSSNNNVSNVFQNGLLLEQSAYFANPMMSKYFMSPWYAPKNPDGTPNLNVGNLYNWLYLKDHDVKYNDFTRGITNNELEWEIIKGLKYKTVASLDFSFINYKNYQNRNYGDSFGENGTVEESMQRIFNYVFQNSLSYNYSFGDHNIQAMALVEYQKNKDRYVYAYGESFVTDGLTNVASAGANKDASSSYTDWMNASYLGMLNYNYQGKYIADFTYRREGSSRFAKGNRFGNFWSFGAAWNISKEEFLSNVTFIDNLRLRASYGISGNSGISLNAYQALLAFDADYAGEGAVYPSGYGNNFLTWEKNNNYDLGIDFGFLNRFSGSIAYFNKKTFDLLQDVPLSLTSGHSTVTRNVGEVVNKGIEAIINVDIVKSKDFNANVSFNFATLANEVTKLAKDGEGNYIVIETGTRKIDVGHPIYEWYLRKYAGVDPNTGLPQWYINGKDDSEGITNDYYAARQALQGKSATPTYSGGASVHIDFKGIYFDANLYFAGGHQVFEDWSFYTWHSGRYSFDLYQGVEDLMRRWQNPGDVTDVPMVTFDGTGYNASRSSTRFLFDGDYVRLKDIVIGYNLPKNLLTKIGYQGTISIFARGNNLYTWVKDKDMKYDPEVRADGFTRFTNPPVKTMTFGINLNF
jgi:TonB-linked SusC/RagA family outer membrane protein